MFVNLSFFFKRNPRLSVKEVVTTTRGPVAKQAYFTNNFASVAIKFSTNLQSVSEDCTNIFGSSNMFGKGF